MPVQKVKRTVGLIHKHYGRILHNAARKYNYLPLPLAERTEILFGKFGAVEPPHCLKRCTFMLRRRRLQQAKLRVEAHQHHFERGTSAL